LWWVKHAAREGNHKSISIIVLKELGLSKNISLEEKKRGERTGREVRGQEGR
jgi:hypothetical protein